MRARRRQRGERASLSASADPGLTMKRLLEEAGIDLRRDNVRIVPSPRRTSPNWAWDGVDAIEQGVSDGYGATACGPIWG